MGALWWALIGIQHRRKAVAGSMHMISDHGFFSQSRAHGGRGAPVDRRGGAGCVF